MNSKNYEESGYMHDLNLLIISHRLRASYPTRSECRAKSVRLRPAYLKRIQSYTPRPHSNYVKRNYRNLKFEFTRTNITRSSAWRCHGEYPQWQSSKPILLRNDDRIKIVWNMTTENLSIEIYNVRINVRLSDHLTGMVLPWRRKIHPTFLMSKYTRWSSCRLLRLLGSPFKHIRRPPKET